MKVLITILLVRLFSEGVLGSVGQIRWLPCQLVEEFQQRNSEGHLETQYQHKDAVLQFGKAGDQPEIPEAITFLVTVPAGTKLDMRRYGEGDAGDLQCEIRRYSTGGIQVHWPGPGAKEDDAWFTCTLRHKEGLFSITTFLRHTPASPVNPQDDYNKWNPIGEREMVSTTAAMLVLTRSPSVETGLLREPALLCQFAVDHRRAELTVEWRLQRRGERNKLFSFSSRSGKSEGTGVSVRAVAGGNASMILPPTTVASEGTYICSVYVPPLYGSQDISLRILESPRVTVTVGPVLHLRLGEERKVVCEAQGYYPLDVQMEWLREARGGRIPEVMKNVLLTSHRHHPDGTYSLSAFFILQPTMEDSGYTYTCRTSHASLRTPVRKSFSLTVTEPVRWTDVLWVFFAVILIALMIVILAMMLRYLNAVRKDTRKSKPY